MKKILLCAASALLMLSACDTGSGTNSASLNYLVANLVYNSTSGESYVCAALYNYNFNFDAGTVALSCDGLDLGNRTKSKFTSDAVKFNAGMYQDGERYGEVDVVENVKANVDNDASLPISDFRSEITGLYYTNSIPQLGIRDVVGPLTIMSYKVGADLYVKSFPVDCVYQGTTNTTFPSEGAIGTFSNNKTAYRVIMNIDDKKIEDSTATVYICDAQFAENMPAISVMALKDLSLKFENGGYVISGENVIPQVLEAGSLTPNETFPFTSFTLRALYNGSVSQATISYTVKNVFQGNCFGSYAAVPKNTPSL